MKWVTDNKDLVSLLVAAVAIVLSISTVVVQIVIQTGQRRHDAFRHIHEMLVDPDVQHGRRLAYVVGETRALPAFDSTEWRLMNRAIGIFDTLATYYQRRLVPRRLVLDVWHHSLRDSRRGAEVIRDYRLQDLQAWTPWPHLWRLLDDADSYHSNLVCCKARSIAPPDPQPSRPR